MNMIEDIPEATREAAKPANVSSGFPLPILLSGILFIGIAGGGFWFLNRPPKTADVAKTAKPVEVAAEPTKPLEASEPEPEPAIEEVENILGHLPYEEAQPSDLVAVTNDGRVRLRHSAAEKFRQLQADASAQGINLAVISGFRSQDVQNGLFFDIKEQRVQDASKRAEVSAPPGHSEHHTGYAIDLGDGNVPSTHLSEMFENTAAFKWLQQNAAKYSFELSFPRDNPQGISYEPWHWRFVGDRHSLETFYKARNLKSSQP